MARFKLESLMNEQLGLKRKVKTRHLRREVIPPREFKISGDAIKIKQIPPSKDLRKLYGEYKRKYT